MSIWYFQTDYEMSMIYSYVILYWLLFYSLCLYKMNFEKLCEQLNEKFSTLYPDECYRYFIDDWYVCVESIGDPFEFVCPLDDEWYQYLTNLLNQSM